MPSACCGRSYGPQQALLDRLALLPGVTLPGGAQLWSPVGGGAGWRVVDRHGDEPVPAVRSTLRVSACLAATGLSVVVVDGGGVVAVGLLQ